jgi:hypothetical protein
MNDGIRTIPLFHRSDAYPFGQTNKFGQRRLHRARAGEDLHLCTSRHKPAEGGFEVIRSAVYDAPIGASHGVFSHIFVLDRLSIDHPFELCLSILKGTEKA